MANKPITIHKAFGLEDKFYIGENKTAQDKTISFELIGLIAYLSSLPNNWEINAGDIMRTGCGRNKAYKMLKELQELGYLHKVKIRNDDGTFKSIDYLFYALREENTEYNPLPQNQDTDNQDTDNQLLQRKEVKKEKKVPLSAKNADAIQEDNSEETTTDNNPELRIVDKLSPIEYEAYIKILNNKFKLNGGRVHDVYHQLRGSISAKKKKTARYEYGQLFRDTPVSLSELQQFLGYYEVVCEGCSYPISADALEDWFGKLRSARQALVSSQSFFQQKRPTNYDEIMEAQND